MAMHFTFILPGHLRRKMNPLDFRKYIAELVKAWELAGILYSQHRCQSAVQIKQLQTLQHFGAMAQV